MSDTRSCIAASHSIREARASIGRYLDFYNGRRPRSSLDDTTPDQLVIQPLPLRMASSNSGRCSTGRPGKSVQYYRWTTCHQPIDFPPIKWFLIGATDLVVLAIAFG